MELQPQLSSRRRAQASAIGVALMLHGVLLGGLALQRLPLRERQPRGAAPQAPVMLLKLLPWVRQEAPAPAPQRPARTSAARAAPAAAAPSPAPAPAPSPVPSPVPLPTREAQAITLPAAPAASSPPPPLNLTLPRAMQPSARGRNPALDDPRANTRGSGGVEARIAAALGGSDRITEEVLADGTVRLRRGSQCVLAHPNRSQQIDPFNGSVAPKPRLIEGC